MTISRLVTNGIATLVLTLLPETAFAQQSLNPLPLKRQAQPSLALPSNIKLEITPPPSLANRAVPNSVTLRGGANSSVLQSLNITRKLPLLQMRSNTVLVLGNSRVNLAPMLSNTRALFNVAKRIRLQPQLASVIAEDTTAYESDKGLIVHSFLTYRIKPGVCNDPQKRATLGQSGVSCPTNLSASARAAAFANPRDVRYVADPAKRAQIIADAESKSALLNAELNTNVAKLRASFSDQAMRAQFDAERGAGEAGRLAALSGEQLKDELVHTSATSIEQTIFVPRADRLDTTSKGLVPINKAPAPEEKKPDIDVATPLNSHIFLTGFTMGRDYEWIERVEKEIGWCHLYCKTYYAQASVNFNYGLGLRFPIRLEGTYQYHKSATGETASVTPKFTPFNGNAADYASTGLPNGLVYQGKEIVAQLSANAFAGYDLPGSSQSITFGLPTKDFTDYLTDDFTGGQFAPPAPGAKNLPSMNKVFKDIDLLGRQADFGILAIHAYPMLNLALTSDNLTFNFRDMGKPSDIATGRVISSDKPIDLAVQASDHSSKFRIGDPIYNASFLVTPGIDADLSINLGVWEDSFPTYLWFPQLQIKLPPDGRNFSCHAETFCSHIYTFTPNSQTDMAGALAPKVPTDKSGAGLEADLESWGLGFDKKWMSECPDETCRVGLRFVRQGTIYNAGHKYDANPKITMSDLAPLFANADEEAKGIINEGQARQTAAAAKSYATLMLAVWSLSCSDSQCLNAMKGIILFAQSEMNALQANNPDMATNEVLAQGGKKFVPALQDEVNKSKARVAVEEALKKKRFAKLVLFNKIPTLPAGLPATGGKGAAGALSPNSPATAKAGNVAPVPTAPVALQNKLPSAVSPALAQKSTLCRFNTGARAGEVQDYAPMAPLLVGRTCQDGKGSSGTVVAQ